MVKSQDTMNWKEKLEDSLLYGLLVAQVIYSRVGHELLGSVPNQGNKKQWPETIEIVSEVRQQEDLNNS